MNDRGVKPNALPAIVANMSFSVANMDTYDPVVSLVPPLDTSNVFLLLSIIWSRTGRFHIFDS